MNARTNKQNLIFNFSTALGLAAGVAGLVGCSAGVSGGPGGPALPDIGGGGKANPAAFADKISGPSIDGEWVSGCVPDAWDASGNGYTEIHFTIKGRSAQREATKYSDASCSTVTKTQKGSALFRYASQYQPSGAYEVDYQVTQNSAGFPGKDAVKLDAQGRLLMANGYYLDNTKDPEIEFRHP